MTRRYKKQNKLWELALPINQWHWSWDYTPQTHTTFTIKTNDGHTVTIYVSKPNKPTDNSENDAGGVVIVQTDNQSYYPVDIATDEHNQIKDQNVIVGDLTLHFTNKDVEVVNNKTGDLVAAPDDKVHSMPSGGEGEISIAATGLLSLIGQGGSEIIDTGGGVDDIIHGGGGDGGGFLQAPQSDP